MALQSEHPEQSGSSWIVLKFGGSSVVSKMCIDNIVAIARQHLQQGKRPLIVCSAPYGVSNLLEQLPVTALQGKQADTLQQIQAIYAQLIAELALDINLIKLYLDELAQLTSGMALLQEASLSVRARVMAVGELMLAQVLVAYLNSLDVSAAWQDARELLISQTGSCLTTNFLAAHCAVSYSQKTEEHLTALMGSVVVTQGFIAANAQGETVLLGRGGSDTSAAYFSVLLQAVCCEIWTDVPGIYTCDPHQNSQARLIKQVDYDEAQEIASAGAKVLHPRCIHPLKENSIPLVIKYTAEPQHAGTRVATTLDDVDVQIKAVLAKSGVLLINIETVSMWQQVGFLVDVFACFKQHDISIDLISTSQSSVTVSLDIRLDEQTDKLIDGLLVDLNQFAKAKLIGPCASISLVGRNIRSVLHKLGGVFSAFEQQQVYLLSQAANDLNLTFVVAEDQVHKLAKKLHRLLIEDAVAGSYFAESWLQQMGQVTPAVPAWWQQQAAGLIELAQQRSPLYVYDADTLKATAGKLKQCDAISQVFYAIKANPKAEILELFYQLDLNFECVSIEEVQHVINLFPRMSRKRILFTPNFAARSEYAQAFGLGVYVTVDNLHPLQNWPEIFAGKDIFVRIDPGRGYGHHKYVVTGGSESKFGIPMDKASLIAKLAEQHQFTVIGLHAHSGSGILYANNWHELATLLAGMLHYFKHVTTLNLGGGLGIVERPSQTPLDLPAFNQSLQQVKAAFPALELWIEPGRYLTAEAGVLLTKVTQLKQKEDKWFVGVDTGMNSLIRPALYGSYHPITNLSQLNEPNTQLVNVVGPICESGDTLGYARLMPLAKEGDVMLIANAGAYGACMSSHYNLRAPAEELLLSLTKDVESVV